MANAGTVNVRFAADVTAFNQSLRQVQTSMSRVETSFSRVGAALNAFIGIGAVVTAIRAVARATAESEAAIAQLDSALKNAGATVGTSSKQFQDFASEMQRLTTFTDEAVIG